MRRAQLGVKTKGTKLRVFNLGVLGVNVVETPLHLQDGELASGQNAELYLDSGEFALRKRPGFDSFGSLDGVPTALVSIPLPDPFTEPDTTAEWLFAPFYDNDAGLDHGDYGAAAVARYSTGTPSLRGLELGDDAHWPGLAPFLNGMENQLANGYLIPRINGKAYFVVEHDNGGFYNHELWSYDGTTETKVWESGTALLTAICGDGQYVYFSADLGSNVNQVYRFDPGAGTATALGETYGTAPAVITGITDGSYSMTVFNGTLYMGVSYFAGPNTNLARVYSIAPTGTNWTQVREVGDAGGAQSGRFHYPVLRDGKSHLYVAFNPEYPETPSVIERMDTAGAWTRQYEVNVYTQVFPNPNGPSWAFNIPYALGSDVWLFRQDVVGTSRPGIDDPPYTGYLHHSTDGGVTWTKIHTFLQADEYLEFVSPWIRWRGRLYGLLAVTNSPAFTTALAHFSTSGYTVDQVILPPAPGYMADDSPVLAIGTYGTDQ